MHPVVAHEQVKASTWMCSKPNGPDFASRCALAVVLTQQLLAVVSIYKALGGGWEICAQPDQDCGGADGILNLRVWKSVSYRP